MMKGKLAILFLAQVVPTIVPIGRADAATVVVPNQLATVDGNGNNSFPFNQGGNFSGQPRYQQVFEAKEIGNRKITITGMNFRPDPISGEAFSANLSEIVIKLSTTTRSVNGLSNVFNNNLGADLTTVFNGNLTLSSNHVGPVEGPKEFDIHVGFTNPFLFDPGQGNLLLEVFNSSNTPTTPFDYSTLMSDSVSRVLGQGADTGGLVVQFEYVEIVPEPVGMLYALTAMIVINVRRRTRWRAACFSTSAACHD